MADLLSEVEYGRILGSFTAVSEDFGDTVAPDAIPLSGRVTFVPSTSNISYINSEGETASLYLAPVNAVISQGRIVGKDGKDGVVLLASNSNNVSASVLWTARISLDPINPGDEAPETHSFLIEVRRGEIASLIDVIKENSRVHNIALFHDAIAEAAAKFWERVESGEFRGNQGPPGPPGVGVGVAGPRGMAGKNGADGAPGVGGNMIPDGDLESPGFLSYGDYQESYDAVSGDKSVSLTNATSRKIAVEPEKSYVGSVYVKADYDVTFKVSLRVFGDQGDIDRVIDYSYEIPSGFWKKVTFLLDSEVGDQSVELVVSSDGRVVLVDNFWLSDSSAVRGLQTELVATQERIEAALDKLDMDIDQVDSERVKLTESLNDLSVILEDAEIDLGNVNNQLDDLRDALANAAVGDNYYRDQNLSKPSGFTEDPSVTHSDGGGFGGGGSITVAPGESVRGAYDTLTIDSDSRTKVARGTQYKISARIQPEGDLPAGGGYLALRPITVAGSILPSDRLDPIFIMAPETPGGTWSEISQVVDIPDGTVEVMVGVFLDASYEGSAVFSDIGVRKAIDGTIIAPGAVGSGQIFPDSVGTPHLIALAITADKIGANAIVAGKIDALAVNTRELAAEAVSAGKLAADSVIAGKVAADTISARELIARSITAEKIETGAITATEIKARTITAAEIATGTITANEIKARTITADEIASGTITAEVLSAQALTVIGQTVVNDINVQGKLIGNDGVFTGTVDFDNINVTGSQIVNKLEANSISGDRIAAGTITGNRIKAGTITGSLIAAGAVSADKVTSGSFEGNTFVGGRFQGGEFQAPANPANNVGGVAIDPVNGLRGWDSSGNKTFQLRPSTGQVNISANLLALNDDNRGVILVPTTSTGGGGLWFTDGGGVDSVSAAIWRATYDQNEPEPLNIRGANGSHVRIYGGLQLADAGLVSKGDLNTDGNLSVTRDIKGWYRLIMPNLPTSGASSANLVIGTTGYIGRTSSSRRYKSDITDWTPDPSTVLRLRPRTWIDRYPLDGEPIRRIPGFVAEEVDELGLTPLVIYADDDNGQPRPESLNYDRFPAAQQVVLRDHESRIKSLENTIESLIEEIKDLRSSM